MQTVKAFNVAFHEFMLGNNAKHERINENWERAHDIYLLNDDCYAVFEDGIRSEEPIMAWALFILTLLWVFIELINYVLQHETEDNHSDDEL